MPANIEQRAAEYLVAARSEGKLLDDLPKDLRPTALAQAYAIQHAAAKLSGPVGGWKVGLMIADEIPTAASIASRYVGLSGGAWPVSTPVGLEVELAFKFGADLPPRPTPYQPTEVAAAIASAHLAFEILRPRFIDKNAVSELTYLADSLGNAGMVLGEAIAAWVSLDFTTLEYVLEVDGKVAASKIGGPAAERTLAAITSLANNAAMALGGIKAGQAVLTGARLGPITVAPGAHAQAIVGGAAKVQINLIS